MRLLNLALYYACICTPQKLVRAAPLSDVILVAGGGIPNAGVPTLISQDAIKELQFTMFLENLEVDFFQNGSNNLTSWDNVSPEVVDVVSRIASQENIHVATLTSLLDTYAQPTIPPCEYIFPVDNLTEFLRYGELITSVGIGAVIGLADRLAASDPLLIKSVASIVTVESRHDAFFRQNRGFVPNPSPFDTGIGKTWAFNLALPFIKPGSCSIGIPLPVLPTLTTIVVPSNGTERRVEFQWDSTSLPSEVGPDQVFIAWVSQLDDPMYSAMIVTSEGNGYTVVPQNITGNVFAALTRQQPVTMFDLEAVTLAGPVIIEL